MLFEKMIDENGQEAVENLFCSLLGDYNWVHKDRSCNESFSIINEKIIAIDPATRFTQDESLLIRRAAFELGIYL